jgi:hypothetical protein
MKKKILLGVLVLALLWIGYRVYKMATTTSHSPARTSRITHEGVDISVGYCSPSKKGREIFGEAKDRAWLPDGKFWTVSFRLLTGLPPTSGALVPNGEYWRLGANEATEISFSKDIQFAGEAVPAGRYRMYAIPYDDTWRVFLNRELGQWGYVEANHAQDVLQVEVPVETAPSEIENFTIDFAQDSTDVQMRFMWEKTMVEIPLHVAR